MEALFSRAFIDDDNNGGTIIGTICIAVKPNCNNCFFLKLKLFFFQKHCCSLINLKQRTKLLAIIIAHAHFCFFFII